MEAEKDINRAATWEKKTATGFHKKGRKQDRKGRERKGRRQGQRREAVLNHLVVFYLRLD